MFAILPLLKTGLLISGINCFCARRADSVSNLAGDEAVVSTVSNMAASHTIEVDAHRGELFELTI